MRLRDVPENSQHPRPHNDQEQHHHPEDRPRGRVIRREEVPPIAPIRRREEEVLDEDRDEEPDHDAALDDGAVEGRDLTGCLAVVVWQAEVDGYTDEPEDEGDQGGDGGEARVVSD